jgi:hypothetical protein
MKKHLLLRNGFVASAILFASISAHTFSSQAPPNRNGSPASNGVTCANSSCHSGSSSGQIITITSDIPTSGFEENTDYTFTVTGDWSAATGANTSGFEASLESTSGFEGTLSSGGNSNVKLVGMGNFASHNGDQGFTSGMTEWSFNWNSGMAPDGTSVYAVINFANGDGGTSGDNVLTKSLQLTKAQNISIGENSIANLKTFPNPTTDVLNISFSNEGISDNSLKLYDMQGRLVKDLYSGKITGEFNESFIISDLSPGIYILNIQNEKGFIQERIIVQ